MILRYDCQLIEEITSVIIDRTKENPPAECDCFVAEYGVLLSLLVSGIYRPKVLLIFSLKRLTQVGKRRDKVGQKSSRKETKSAVLMYFNTI